MEIIEENDCLVFKNSKLSDSVITIEVMDKRVKGSFNKFINVFIIEDCLYEVFLYL